MARRQPHEDPELQILALNAFGNRPTDGLAPDIAALVERRRKSFGAGSVLFYDEPLKMVRAEGAYLYASDGRAYLDFYNNVPTVGHCHPKVVEAVRRQVGELNIHSRYLFDVAHDYAEALLATFPAELSNLVLTCTGGESNDLALRLARKASGGGGFVVTRTAYHGNTAAVTEVSPSSYKNGAPPPHARMVPPPDPAIFGNDVRTGFADAVSGAIAAMEAGRHPLCRLAGGYDLLFRWCVRRSRGPAQACGRRGACGRAACSSPTRRSPASGALARACGALPATAWCRTSSPWASRWAMAIRSPGW